MIHLALLLIFFQKTVKPEYRKSVCAGLLRNEFFFIFLIRKSPQVYLPCWVVFSEFVRGGIVCNLFSCLEVRLVDSCQTTERILSPLASCSYCPASTANKNNGSWSPEACQVRRFEGLDDRESEGKCVFSSQSCGGGFFSVAGASQCARCNSVPVSLNGPLVATVFRSQSYQREVAFDSNCTKRWFLSGRFLMSMQARPVSACFNASAASCLSIRLLSLSLFLPDCTDRFLVARAQFGSS